MHYQVHRVLDTLCTSLSSPLISCKIIHYFDIFKKKSELSISSGHIIYASLSKRFWDLRISYGQYDTDRSPLSLVEYYYFLFQIQKCPF